MTTDQDSPQGTPETSDDQPSATDKVFAAFGGIRPMAHKLGMPVTTVQGWKKRGAIPQQRHDAIRAGAREHGVALDDAALTASAPPDAPAEPARPHSRPAAQAAAPPAGPSSKQPQPAAKISRQRSATAWSALILALISLAVAATAPLWTGPAYRMVGLSARPGPAAAGVDPARLDSLENRLAGLERRMETLSGTARSTAETGALTAQLQAMERRLTALEQIATPALAGRVAAIGGAVDALAADVARLDGALGNQRIGLTEARAVVTSLEARADEAETRLQDIAATQRRDGRRIDRLVASDSATQALVLAIGQLRTAVDAGQPYAQPLAALQALAAGIDETVDDLAALAPRSATGIPDRDALKTGFPAMAQAVRDAVRLPADAGLMDQVIAKIEGLVTVRPAAGEVEGDDVGAILARAEGRLDTGDLSGAVAALALLEGDAAEAAAAWRRSAEARLAAEAALGNLNSFVIARLANNASDGSRP